MAFGNARKGFSVSSHFQLKPSAVIRHRLDRMHKFQAPEFANVKVVNALMGILKSRGERI